MPIFLIDPLTDPRWVKFLEVHPQTSVFHSAEWLSALKYSYDYEPVVMTTSGPDEPLRNGLVLCKIRSWLTGARIVSLPFSDHCQPLVDDPKDLGELLRGLCLDRHLHNWKYIEIRPLGGLGAQLQNEAGFAESESFCFHSLDLRLPLEEVHRRFHKTSIQQTLQRAEREGLTIEVGQSEALIRQFYSLLLLTRRRHQLPPQPISWFRSLVSCFGESASIRVAYKSGRPVASIFTLAHKKTVVYKYGCSDARFNNLGGTPYLLWEVIQQAKGRGAESLDFGRSGSDQTGLIKFKDRWGACRSQLTYYRYPMKAASGTNSTHRSADAVGKALSTLPDVCLETVGRVLYRHVG